MIWCGKMEYTTGSVVFNDWIITREIGQGATGKVFEIEKSGYGITVKSALKVIRIPKSLSDIQAVRNEGMTMASVEDYFREFVDEILREVRIMVSLKEHPNIVSYEDHCVVPHESEVGWDVLIKMELLTPLSEWQGTHQMDEQTVIRLGREISSALAYAAEHDLIHRDVKPENIFVNEAGKFKLGDFGIARTIEKTTGGLSKKGTESYMAPEVYHGNPYSRQVDIYSLGIVLYRFLNNNRLPFYPPVPEKISYSSREEALMKRIQGLPFPEPQNGSAELKRIVLKACEYLPENRYASMSELHNDLQKLWTGDGGKDTGDGPGGGDPPRRFKIGKWLIAGALSICVLTGIAFGMNQKKEPTTPIVYNAQIETTSDVTENVETATSASVSEKDVEEVAATEPVTQKATEPLVTEAKYQLTVNNGSGSGNYTAGERVSITADEVDGMTFIKWVDQNGVSLSEQQQTNDFIMPSEDTSLTAVYEKSKNGYTVAIDPGHTGCVPDITKKVAIGPGSSEIVDMFASEYAKNGTGAVGKNTGIRECDIDLGVGQDLKSILVERGYDVILLREDNNTPTGIQERTLQANESGADILIQIYCRKSINSENRGGMVYLPTADNPYVGYMYEQCNALGNEILYNYCKLTGFENAGIQYKDNEPGTNWSKIPVVLMKLGCLTDSVDEARLADADNWNIMAEGIANGIDEYFKN